VTIEAIPEILPVATPKEEVKSDKANKKKHVEAAKTETESADFKKGKKKPKYQTFDREEDDQDAHRRGGRNKFKKKKGNLKRKRVLRNRINIERLKNR